MGVSLNNRESVIDVSVPRPVNRTEILGSIILLKVALSKDQPDVIMQGNLS